MADLHAGGPPGCAVQLGGGDAAPPAAAPPVADGCGMLVESAGESAQRGEHGLPGAGFAEFLREVWANGIAGFGQAQYSAGGGVVEVAESGDLQQDA